MAVTTQNSTEYAALIAGTTQYPTELNGEPQKIYFTHDQSGAGDATSSVILGILPPGRVRLLLNESYAFVDWTTASATLDLGWDAYTALSDGSAVAADPDGLCDGIDVDAIGLRTFSGTGIVAANRNTGYSKLFESRSGVIIRATSQDTAIISGDDLVGVLTYIAASC